MCFVGTFDRPALKLKSPPVIREGKPANDEAKVRKGARFAATETGLLATWS